MTSRAIFFSLLVGCGAATTTTTATPSTNADYDVRLMRPTHIGDRWRIQASGAFDESSKTYTEQVLVKKTERHWRLRMDAVASAVAVDAQGDPSRVDYVVTSFTNGADVVVAAGKHIAIELAPKKEDSIVDVDGAHASTELRAMIDAIIPIAHQTGNADVIMGTRDRQRIGGAWSFDVPAMAGELARSGIRVKPEDLSGRVSLAGAEKVDGVDCVDVRIDLAVRAFAPATNLPEESEITHSTVSVRIDELLPVDVHLPRRRDDLEVHATFEAFVPVKTNVEVSGVTVESRTDHTRHATYTPL